MADRVVPSSHRVRQRLTELGVSYLLQQVPAERQGRAELISATGHESIPVLVADGEVIAGEKPIISYLNTHFAEPPEAAQHGAKAAKAKNKEQERTCLKLTASTR